MMDDELEVESDLVALYRNAAREVPNEKLDRAVLGKAHAVAWRRRNRAFLLAAASCGTLALAVGLLSAVATTKMHSAIDTAEYGMTTGRVELYLMTANASPGMNVRPELAKQPNQSGVE